MTKQLIAADALQRFLSVGESYCTWFDQMDPDLTTLTEVAAALSPLVASTISSVGKPKRPQFRNFKPNEEWQRNQRKALRLPMNGYRAPLIPNDDGIAFTLCSLAYDLCDFYEQIARINVSKIARYLDNIEWEYTRLRIRACIDALGRRAPERHLDPFQRLPINGRKVRFVGWRTGAWTHVSEDHEGVRGASTLCGGRLAYHKHTHQQWTCYWCQRCRAALHRPSAR